VDLDAKVRKYKSLKNFKHKSDEEVKNFILEKEANDKAEDALDVASLFTDKEEKKLAKELSRKYLSEYSIESTPDRNTLKQLIYLETLQSRLNDVLNGYKEQDKMPAPQIIDALHKNVKQISDLKTQLQLVNPKGMQMESGLKTLMALKKKFIKWREENQGSRSLLCPHCGKMTMLKIRTDAWEAQKHPFFQDRLLTNKYLFQLYDEDKITLHDIAKVLETSEDYVKWIRSKLYDKG